MIKTNSQYSSDLSPLGIIIIDQRGVITETNAAADNLLGWSNLKKSKIHIDHLIGPFASYKKNLYGNAINNESPWRQQRTILKKNEESIDVEICVKKREDGLCVGFIQDITEQKKDQAKLKEIVHMQCHDVRAPLANILGLVNLIDFDNQSKKVNISLLTHLKVSAKKLDVIIRKIVLKALSKHEVKKTKFVLFFLYWVPLYKLATFLKIQTKIFFFAFANLVKSVAIPLCIFFGFRAR